MMESDLFMSHFLFTENGSFFIASNSRLTKFFLCFIIFYKDNIVNFVVRIMGLMHIGFFQA